MTFHRSLGVAAALTAALITGSAAPASAAGKSHGLAARHHCVSADAQMRPPVAGYLVRDTARPERGLFYVGSGSLTSGLLAGWGGTWVLVAQCRR